MAFFVDWALWVKMLFVATVVAGLIKLSYDQWKLRKFTRIEKEKMEEQPMVEEFARQRRGRQETPFGVRAIESGIEVEGVWISRNNSPANSAPGSPMISPQVKGKAAASRTSEIPSIQIPEQAHPYTQDRSASPNGSMGSFEKATSAERLESVSGSSELTPVPRHTYKPRQPSGLRYSTADDLEAGKFDSNFSQPRFNPSSGQLPLRSASGSSQTSSEGSNSASGQQYHHPSGYQAVREPTYYRPSGMDHYNNNSPTSSQFPRQTPDYAQPSRSSRSSYTGQGYANGPRDSHQPPTPQRFHSPIEQPTTASDPFANPSFPSNRSYVDSRQSQMEPVSDTIELTNNPTMGNVSPEKAKRITRKLQKKTPGS